MSNSNVTTVKKETPKNAPKNGAKQPTAAELQKQIEKLENERLEMIADLRGLEEEKTDLAQEVEKTLLENATLKANAKHAKEETQKQISEAQKKAEQAVKAAINPTHATAEEKLNSLGKANEISELLKRKKQSYEEFTFATKADEREYVRVIFQRSESSKFPLGNPEITKTLIEKTKEFMLKSIEETEKELLMYQI
ncbi:hypothetical protein V9L05_01340 [Bernardetia sp. Wsw4-3y2]|uniref:hypothetical protein n=1 Tax=Bernardetia sp. Wsw4-3y2 TaxID=3127471 RepID=UPI0030CDE222